MENRNLQLQKEANRMNKLRGGSYFAVTTCKLCGKQEVAGKTAEKCSSCWHDKQKEISKMQNKKSRLKRLELTKEKDKCLFCLKQEGLHIHHIDKNHSNNAPENLMLVCGGCHKKLHGRIYRPLFRRLFGILIKERLTYDEIGKLFSTTKQNVYGILNEHKKKLST